MLNSPLVTGPWCADADCGHLLSEHDAGWCTNAHCRKLKPCANIRPGDTAVSTAAPQTQPTTSAVVRTFATGANRDTDTNKLDFDGFLSPLVLRRYAEYMHLNRRLADGSLRDSDNWQRGIPPDVYRKSLWRHFFDAWALGRAATSAATDTDLERALCAVIFNASGWLHEVLRKREASS